MQGSVSMKTFEIPVTISFVIECMTEAAAENFHRNSIGTMVRQAFPNRTVVVGKAAEVTGKKVTDALDAIDVAKADNETVIKKIDKKEKTLKKKNENKEKKVAKKAADKPKAKVEKSTKKTAKVPISKPKAATKKAA